MGAVLVVIGEEGEAVAAAPASSTRDEARAPATVESPSTSPDAKVRATPLVRRIAQELGVDIASVTGSGSDGRSPRTTCAQPCRAAAGHRRAAGSGSAACVGRSSSISRLPTGDSGRHLRRGMRLHGRRPRAARTADAEGDGSRPTGVPRAQRETRRRRNRLSRSVRPRGGRPDGCGSRRARRPRLRYGLARRARGGGRAAGCVGARGNAHTGGAPRLDLHGHERRQAGRPFRHPTDQPSRSRDPRRPPHRRAPGRAEGDVVARSIGHVSVTFDHRVVDGARGGVRASSHRQARGADP